MDHDPPFDEGGSGLADENFDLIDTVDGDISSLNFGKVVKVTDFDGDSVVLDNAFKIQIRDDVPELEEKSEPVTLTVDEDDINTEQSEGTSPNDGSGDGSVTGNPSSDEEGPAVASANLSGLVKSGADEELTFMFVNEAAAVEFLDGLGLRSQGELLSYDVSDDGSMLTATAGTGEDARIVFKLTVAPNGQVTFELFDQMDHDPPFDQDPSGFPADPAVPGDNPPLADQNTDLIDFDDEPPAEVREFDISQIDFGSIIKAVDFDGDAVVLDGQFGVTIRDDIPELTGKKVVKVVDEDDINTDQSEGTSPNDGTGDGSATGNPPSDATGPAFVSGSLAGVVESGADEPLTFSFVDGAADQFNGLGLSSKGEELVFQVDGNMLTASAGDRLVLKVTVESDGDFTVELFDQMDHDLPFDQGGSGLGGRELRPDRDRQWRHLLAELRQGGEGDGLRRRQRHSRRCVQGQDPRRRARADRQEGRRGRRRGRHQHGPVGRDEPERRHRRRVGDRQSALGRDRSGVRLWQPCRRGRGGRRRAADVLAHLRGRRARGVAGSWLEVPRRSAEL